MKPLIVLMYASAATVDFDEESLRTLLDRARQVNARLGVTGMLLYTEGSFFQVLEGDPLVVGELFARIKADTRHGRVVEIIREPIGRRSFADWTMGFVTLDRDDVSEIVGRNDFFGQGSCYAQLDPGRAKKLLEAFAAGRWRSRLDERATREPVGAGVGGR